MLPSLAGSYEGDKAPTSERESLKSCKKVNIRVDFLNKESLVSEIEEKERAREREQKIWRKRNFEFAANEK